MTILGVSPYLSYRDASAALEWLQQAFGWGPVKRYPAEGPVAEAEITLADGIVVHLKGLDADNTEEAHTRGYRGRGDTIILSIDDAQRLYERVRSAGIDVEEPAVESYGPKVLYVPDPGGYMWTFWEGEAQYD